MDEHCCESFRQAMVFNLIEKVDCPKAEYCFKNNFCYVFIKFCPFCGDELEAG